MSRLTDLSMPVESGFTIHAPHPATRLVPIILPHMPGSHGKTVHKFDGLLHTGTHVDSALELRPDGLAIDRLPLEAFMGPAVIADVSVRVPRGEVTAQDLEQAVGDSLAPGFRLLMRTGWSSRYGQAGYFEDSPYLSIQAAEWCVARGVSLAGVDFQPVRRGDTTSGAKRVFAEHNIPFLSNLCNLNRIRSQPFTLIAFPVLLNGVEAAMARAVALEED